MASLLRAVLLCAFMAALSLLLLHDAAARELTETRRTATPGGKDDGTSIFSEKRHQYFYRRGRETNEVRWACEYLPPISYCCHVNEVPMCFYSKHDCLLNCVQEVPPAKH